MDRENYENLLAFRDVLGAQGKNAELEAILREARAMGEAARSSGGIDSNELIILRPLVEVLRVQGKYSEAEEVARGTLELIAPGSRWKDSPWHASFLNLLAKSLLDQGEFAEAMPLARRVLLNSKSGNSAYADALEILSGVHAGLGNAEKAEVCRLRAAGVRVRFRQDGAKRSDQSEEDEIQEGAGSSIVALDQFDGKLGLDWDVVNRDPSHVSLTTKPGTLTITTQAGGLFQAHKGAKNIFLIDNPVAGGGDFVLTTRIVSFQPAADHQQAGLVCWDDEDNYIKGVSIWSPRDFQLLTETEGHPWYTNVKAKTASPAVWLRLSKSSRRYTFSTSADGKTYRVIAALPWGSGSPKKIGLLAKNGLRSMAGIDASFDFFEVRTDTQDAEPD